MSQTSSSPVAAAPALRPVNVPLLLRRVHGWTGLLIAPSVLFFALTGAAQLFNLHEAHGSYTPPAALVALSALHKDQALPRAKAGPPDTDADHDHGDDHHHGDAEAAPRVSTLALKWVFLAVSLGLVVSTALGLWMAFQDRRRRALNAVLLAIGVLAPLLLALA